MRDTLWYKGDAACFSEALPIGNGSLGAMVYGNFPEFKLTLNKDTLWSGRPGKGKTVHVEKKDREKVRELISRKKYFEAKGLMQERMLGTWTESYLSAAFLHISMQGADNWENGERYLSMQEASAYSKGSFPMGQVRTEAFASFADDVIGIRIEADSPITLSVSMDSVLRFSSYAQGESLFLTGEAPVHVEPNYVECSNPVVYGGGMAFAVGVKVAENDGSLSGTGQEIRIRDMKKVTLLCAVQTGFRGYGREPETDGGKAAVLCKGQLDCLGAMPFAELKERHLAVYCPLYNRVSFHLEDTGDVAVPTEAELPLGSLGDGPGLYERLFQYGRYLMLSSSYPQNGDTQPANLQGIWCEDVRPVWSCNWTTNINIEMNYWLTGPCGLTECETPLIQMIKELAEAGKDTARETCGCRGWAVFHNTDIWRQTAPSKGEIKYAFWPMAGVWLSTHLYQHYLFTQDESFLRMQAYPAMKAAAEFCVDWLWEDEKGILHTSPSTSPENEFLDGRGRACPASDSSTMDIVLVRELLSNTKEAAQLLSVDLDFAFALEEIIQKLPGFAVGKYGQLQEWSMDFEEADPGHRHMAHLTALHPFFQITCQETPELAAAAERSIERRLSDNPQYIGWTEAWLTNFYARLHDGEKALEHLGLFLKYCTYKNLMSLHPKLGESFGEKEIFQIDGNFGITAGISEMLLQSFGHVAILLPALPDAWKNGEISGLCTRGGLRVKIRWKDGRIRQACLEQLTEGTNIIRYKYLFRVELPEGEVLASVRCGGFYQAEYTGKAGTMAFVRMGD